MSIIKYMYCVCPQDPHEVIHAGMHGSEPSHKHIWDGAEKDGARGETENGPEKLGKIMHGWLGFVMWSKLTGWLVG